MAGVRLYNHTAVADVVRQLATMTDSELADVARRLVTQDAALAERLADEVLDCVYVEPPPGMVIGGPAVRLDDE